MSVSDPVTILAGDAIDRMREIPDSTVQTCVTSPPYYGLRDYDIEPTSWPDVEFAMFGGMPPITIPAMDCCLGLEPAPFAFVGHIVHVFREVYRVLRDDGTLWLNLGDSYAGSWGAEGRTTSHGNSAYNASRMDRHWVTNHPKQSRRRPESSSLIKPKDMYGIPWMVAFALRADGWYLRQDIIWCLSGGAWVYARTQKGDMPVMVKDLVRLDPSTVRLWNGEKWTSVLGWGPSNDESERLELVLRSGERIGCTGGHQWPTQRGNVMARDLRVGDTIRTCRLPEPDGCERPGCLTNDALWLIGLYLAEGSRSGNASARQLSLSADEQHWIPRIEAVAKHYGGSCGYTVSGGTLAVRLYGQVLHALIDAYVGGAVAIDKHLRVATWRLPNESLSALVQGYLDGDGHDDAANGRWRLGFCRNYSLERDLRTLAARLGATLTLKPGTNAYQGGDAPTFRGEWRWERSGHWNEKDRGEIVEIRASRARGFWDIAVEDEPHLFALASGVLTHNCKPNPMPESTKDRCAKAHEYIFLLSKSPKYFFNANAIREPSVGDEVANGFRGGAYVNGNTFDNAAGGKRTVRGNKKVSRYSFARTTKYSSGDHGGKPQHRENREDIDYAGTRNKRSVWSVSGRPFPGAHFATFPPTLVEPCILAGSRQGDAVLDPFTGSGTTGLVARRLRRTFIGCEANPRNVAMADARIRSGGIAYGQEPDLDERQCDLFGAKA